MKTKTVLRHHCDFCGKGSFKKPTMAAHEASCTLNPNRICYLCEQSHDLPPLIKRAIAASSEDDHKTRHIDDEKALTAIYHDVESCPACMLAVLRQAKVMAFSLFDYRTEKTEWLNERNREASLAWRC